MRDRAWSWQSTSTTRWQLCKLFKASLSTGQGNRDSTGSSRDSPGSCRETEAAAEAAAERQVMAQVAIYQLKLCLTTRTPEDSHHKKAKRSNSLSQVSKIKYPKLMKSLNNCMILSKFIFEILFITIQNYLKTHCKPF